MNITYIASVRIPSEKASGLAIMRQCEAFANAGHVVTVLRPHRTNHITDDAFTYYGIEKKFTIQTLSSIDFKSRLGVFGFYIARVSQMVVGILHLYKHRSEIDVIYARDPWMLVLPVLFLGRKQIIWEAHQAQKGTCVSFIAKQADLLVCITGGLRDFYKAERSIGKTLVEPSGVNVEQFENLPPSNVIRARFNISAEKKVIGYIGKYKTMGETKGVDELIHAFAQAHKEHSDTHLLIVGLEDGEKNHVHTLCVQSGIEEGSFSLLSLIQKDFALYVHMADILVMNYPDTEHYRKYMSPTKLFAYMASGKLTVASDLPSVREIADESVAILVKPDDADDLARGITEALAYTGAKEELARTRVQRYTWTKRGERILNSIPQ